MKCFSFIFQCKAWVKVFFALALPLSAGAQVLVQVNPPPPGLFSVNDLYGVVLTNTTLQSLHVRLAGTVAEASEGLILEARSADFTLPPGVVNITQQMVEPVDFVYTDNEYKNFILNTGIIPEGTYIICMEVLPVEPGEPLGKDCIEHVVLPSSPPQLVFPLDGSQVTTDLSTFSWMPPVPMTPGMNVFYKIIISEILEGQLPKQAVLSVPPWYEAEGLNMTSFVYPLAEKPLEEGKIYAWQVQAYTEGGVPFGQNQGVSEVFTFQYGASPGHLIIPVNPVAPCVGNVTAEVTTEIVDFRWQATGMFNSFAIVVYSNACGQYPPPPPGTPVPRPPTTPPTGPVTPPVTPPTGPVTPPTGPITPPTGPITPPGGGQPGQPGGPVTTPTGSGTTVTPVPADTGGTTPPAGGGIVDWPDEGETPLPPLPPGWEWGPEGPRWTGELPPEPPDLPPGWEWGPLRPVWVGEGTPPPERKVLGTSVTMTIPASSQPSHEPVIYEASMPLNQILKPGQAFVYQVYGTFTASDGSSNAYLSESQCLRYGFNAVPTIPVVPLACDPCNVKLEPEKAPAMGGGLEPPTEKITIKRDEFIPLYAVGEDYDEIWWYCRPKPLCPETGSSEMRPTSSRVRFNWEIKKGEGELVEIGCLKPARALDGDRVIFMPPYVKPDSTKETEIELQVIDDNPTQPLDETVKRKITIKTYRPKDYPDVYRVEITSDPYKLPNPEAVTGLPMGTCRCRGPIWRNDKDLKTPEILLPEVQDKDKVVFLEWVRLKASDIRDPDEIEVWCESAICPTNRTKRVFEDDVEYTWKINSGGGKFIKGEKGRFVLYEAPAIEGDVEIQVEVFNPSGLKIIDEKPGPAKIKLKIYQPGVRLDTTPIAWLPRDSNFIQVKSSLVYKDRDQWKEGFQHQCRIHFFEMLDVSTEPGVCLNWPPVDSADACPDLTIKKTDTYEVDDSLKCDRWKKTSKTYFKKANTKKPVREFSIRVKAEDFGAYGFIRSIANGDKSLIRPYKSVPWKRTEVTHPLGRPMMKVYDDNRVSIPRDIDENHIPDGGWKSYAQLIDDLLNFRPPGTGPKEPDPANSYADVDSVPSSDNRGDGISAYQEYRGFFTRGTHKRFGQLHKDLLIYDKSSLDLGYFNKTRITCWKINEREFDANRVINRNQKTTYLGFEQKGIRLLNVSNTTAAGLMAGLYGLAKKSITGQGLRTCDSVMINVSLIATGAMDQSSIIAHELSHAISVRHHGEGVIKGRLVEGDSVIVDGVKMKAVGGSWSPYIACKQGSTSGDVNCWMRYSSYIRHCPVSPLLKAMTCGGGSMNNVNLHMLELSAVVDNVAGGTINNHKNGTGVNSGGNCAQEANMGECIKFIKVSCTP